MLRGLWCWFVATACDNDADDLVGVWCCGDCCSAFTDAAILVRLWMTVRCVGALVNESTPFFLCYCRRSVRANKKILVTVERLGECCAIFEYRTPCPFYVAANAVFIQFELFALSLPLVMLPEIFFQLLL